MEVTSQAKKQGVNFSQGSVQAERVTAANGIDILSFFLNNLAMSVLFLPMPLFN